jgi:hypothetical protein
MFLSAVSVLVVVQPSSEVPEGLMYYPVYTTALQILLAARGGTALRVRRSRPRSPIGSLELSIDIFLPATNGPEVGSDSNRNKYQEYLLRCKGDRCVGLTTLPPSCANFLEIWEPQSPGTPSICPGL